MCFLLICFRDITEKNTTILTFSTLFNSKLPLFLFQVQLHNILEELLRWVKYVDTHKEETIKKADWKAIYLKPEEQPGIRVPESKPIFATYSFVISDMLISLNFTLLSIKLHKDSHLNSVISYSLQPYGLQHARLICPSPTPRAYSNSYPLSRWCHPTIPSSVVPFSS